MKLSKAYLRSAERLEASMRDGDELTAWYAFIVECRQNTQWMDEGIEIMQLFGVDRLRKNEVIIALCFAAAIAESEGD